MDAASQTQPPVQPSPLLLSPHNEAERSTPIPFSDPAPSFSEPRPEPSTTPNNRSSDPNSAPVSFDMNHSGPWTTPWNWGGSLGSNNSQNTNHGQDHDRDSPMPDAQPEPEIPSLDEEPPPPAPPARNIVRVTSNGTSIDSADPPDLRNDPPAEPTDEDMTDNQMPDAPTDEQLLNETGGDPNTHRPPEPPDPELTQHPPVSNYETPWYQIPEDRSYAEEDELKRLESAGEVSALDHEHWMQKTFKDLQDPGKSTRHPGLELSHKLEKHQLVLVFHHPYISRRNLSCFTGKHLSTNHLLHPRALPCRFRTYPMVHSEIQWNQGESKQGFGDALGICQNRRIHVEN